MVKKIRCDKCGYEWKTSSNLKFVTCPNCQFKVKLEKIIMIKQKEVD